MRHLHDTLRSEHHLRHFGRLQYGLFLKSIGLSLEDALTFWRAEFTKKMDVDKVKHEINALSYNYKLMYNFFSFFFSLRSSMPTMCVTVMGRRGRELTTHLTAA